MNKEHKKKIRKLARQFGIKLSNRNCHDSWEWNGKTIATNDWKRPASNIIHDIAHWICSSEEFRKAPDFGLGQGVDSGKPAEVLVRCDIDHELTASCLGILIERQLGMNWHHTYQEHSWGDYPFTDFLKEKEKIRKRGLTTYGGRLILPS